MAEMRDTSGVPARPFEGLVLLAFFALPMLVSLVQRLMFHQWWFEDLDAVLCSAQRVAHHASPYAEAMSCQGGEPAAYMYLPQLANLMRPLAGGADISGLRLVFGPLMVAVTIWLLYLMFIAPMGNLSRTSRAPIMAMLSGGAVGSANLAFPAHALVYGVAMMGRRRGAWPLLLIIVAVSMMKPIYLTYLLIFAYEPERLALRAGRIAAGVALAAAAAGLILATGGPELNTWRAALQQVALGDAVGFGFFNWMGHLGFAATDRITEVAYVVFAGSTCLAGLAVAEGRQLDRPSRILLAIGVAQLVNPRLMTYDLLMLAPLVVAFDAVPGRWRKPFSYAVFLVGLGTFVMWFSGIQQMVRSGPAVLTLLLFAAAALAMWDMLRARGALGAVAVP